MPGLATRAQTLGDAVNAIELVWTTGGNAGWEVESAVTWDGVAAVQSGRIGNLQSTWLQTTVTGPTNVTFWWKVSSEALDPIQFFVGGVKQASISGEADWEPRNFAIPAGEQTVQWVYWKTPMGSKGMDRAWVDQVSLSGPLAPSVLGEPRTQIVPAGDTTVFRVVALGTEPMAYQWRFNGSDLRTATNAVLPVVNSQAANTGEYSVVVTNAYGATTSQVAVLTVAAAGPTITVEPMSHGAAPGSTVRFSAEAKGTAPLGWQWYFNANAIPGATASSMYVTNAQARDFGRYWATVTNEYGNATSGEATLSYSPVLSWGYSSYDLTSVASGATNVLAMAGGDSHALVLRDDGRVVAWGSDYYGQSTCDLTNARAISAGSFHSLAVQDGGTVAGWGQILGGLNAVPEEATNVVALALGPGAQHALALRSHGTVLDWGNPGYGLTTVPPTATNVVAVAAGAQHGAALRGDGTVVAWGDNSRGTCNVPKDATNIIAIACGWYHTLALREDGSLRAWLTVNNFGQTNIPAAATNIVAIACGGNHCLALREDGKLFAWGDNSRGPGQTNVPPWATNIVATAGTSYGSLALIGDGPPRIVGQPIRRNALAGDKVGLIGSVVGARPLTYQWLRDGEPVSGATRLRFSVTNIQSVLPVSYSLVASNALGAVTGQVALVTVLSSPPRITRLTKDVAAPLSSVAELSVSIAGSEPLAYQWVVGGTNLADSARVTGVNSPALVVKGVQTEDLGDYNVIITNAYGAVTSSVVTLRLATVAEAIGQAVDWPQSTWTYAGSPWEWQVDVTHDGVDAAQSGSLGVGGYARIATTYSTSYAQPCCVFFWWKVSSQTNLDTLSFSVDSRARFSISGEVDWQRRSFAVPGGSHTFDWQYQKLGLVPNGSDHGWVDQVTFGAPEMPLLTSQPSGGTITAGSSVALSVKALGTEPFAYQWRCNGTNLLDKTSASLPIPNIQAADAGYYTVVVTNFGGAITSSVAPLAVLPPGVVTYPWLTRVSDNRLQISWSVGTLETAEFVEGPWSEVQGVTPPLSVAIEEGRARFFRVRL